MRPRSHAEIQRVYDLMIKARKKLFDKTVLTPARERRLRLTTAAAKRALHAAGYPVAE